MILCTCIRGHESVFIKPEISKSVFIILSISGTYQWFRPKTVFLFLVDIAQSFAKWKDILWSASIGVWINRSIISSRGSLRLWCLSLCDTWMFFCFLWTCCINVPMPAPLTRSLFFSNAPPQSVKITESDKGAQAAWTVERRPPSVSDGWHLTTRGSFTLKQSILQPVSRLLTFLSRRRF